MAKGYPTSVVYEGYDRALALESVGAGWATLINELFDFIQHNNIRNVRIIQVKEKWGGLRVYTDFENKILEDKIQELEKRSFEICEVSGAPGKLRNVNGWYRTLSDAEANGHPVVEPL